MSKPTLGYWDLRGFGQPIRLFLTYAGVDFVDKRYKLLPNFDRSEWLNDKFNLGLDFPNLPYYMEGDLKMTQTLAILRYLGHRHQMDGKDENEKIRISLCEQQTVDMVLALARVAYDPNCEKLKVDYLKNLPDTVKLLSKFLGDHPFVAGANISYVDFYLYEYLSKLKVMIPEVFSQFDNLKRYHERIEALPSIAAYIKKQKPYLFHGPMAKWNGEYA